MSEIKYLPFEEWQARLDQARYLDVWNWRNVLLLEFEFSSPPFRPTGHYEFIANHIGSAAALEDGFADHAALTDEAGNIILSMSVGDPISYGDLMMSRRDQKEGIINYCTLFKVRVPKQEPINKKDPRPLRPGAKATGSF